LLEKNEHFFKYVIIFNTPPYRA